MKNLKSKTTLGESCPVVKLNDYQSPISRKRHYVQKRPKPNLIASVAGNRLLKNLHSTPSVTQFRPNYPSVSSVPFEINIKQNFNEQSGVLDAENWALPIGSEMIPVIVHEIRTSLSAVTHFLELLKSGELTNTEITDLIYMLEQQMTTVLNFTDDLVMWGKVSVCDKTALHKTTIDIHKLASDIFNDFKVQSVIKKISLINDIPENVFVSSTSGELRFILNNLVSNAIKFTDQGYIRIFLSNDGSKTKIHVTDNGQGISLEKIVAILQNQNCMSSIGSRMEKGTGLGLIIVKNILARRKSQLFIESLKGKTDFSFWLF